MLSVKHSNTYMLSVKHSNTYIYYYMNFSDTEHRDKTKYTAMYDNV